MTDRALTGTIEQIADKAQNILRSIVPEASSVAQEWDNRIDCIVKLPDGSVIGEMIALSEATEKRIRETAQRLKLRQSGIDVQLQNELREPIRISRST